MSDNGSSEVLLDREEMAAMLENWFLRRISMSNKAMRLMLIPLAAVLVLAVTFWFSYYIPVPSMVLLLLLGAAFLVWVICFFTGMALVRKVRTGDSIMLRKIRASGSTAEVDKS